MPLSDRARAPRDRDVAHSPGRARTCLASRPDDGPAVSKARQRTFKEGLLVLGLSRLPGGRASREHAKKIALRDGFCPAFRCLTKNVSRYRTRYRIKLTSAWHIRGPLDANYAEWCMLGMPLRTRRMRAITTCVHVACTASDMRHRWAGERSLKCPIVSTARSTLFWKAT